MSMTYDGQMLAPFTLLLTGWALAALTMLALWGWYRRNGNAGIVDVGWAATLGGLAVVYAALGPGWPARKWLIAGMMGVWAGRLAIYLLRDRVIGRPEDARYAALRQGRASPELFFFVFFQAQALLNVLLALPALIPAFNETPGFAAVEIAAVGLWVLALAGETLADRQLERFKANPANRGRTCRDGLWRYSRHPNYFFEWLVWVAYAAYALGSPWGSAALACPAVMLYLLFRVTGIPATEAQALRTRGDDYRRYQETTSAFVPWFPGS